MPDCDAAFEALGVDTTPGNQNLAVYTAYRLFGNDKAYTKWLIMCWFDATYGKWELDRWSKEESRARMAEFLATTPYDTYEELIADPNYGGTHAGSTE